jgi:hypothetical protein
MTAGTDKPEPVAVVDRLAGPNLSAEDFDCDLAEPLAAKLIGLQVDAELWRQLKDVIKFFQQPFIEDSFRLEVFGLRTERLSLRAKLPHTLLQRIALLHGRGDEVFRERGGNGHGTHSMTSCGRGFPLCAQRRTGVARREFGVQPFQAPANGLWVRDQPRALVPRRSSSYDWTRWPRLSPSS